MSEKTPSPKLNTSAHPKSTATVAAVSTSVVAGAPTLAPPPTGLRDEKLIDHFNRRVQDAIKTVRCPPQKFERILGIIQKPDFAVMFRNELRNPFLLFTRILNIFEDDAFFDKDQARRLADIFRNIANEDFSLDAVFMINILNLDKLYAVYNHCYGHDGPPLEKFRYEMALASGQVSNFVNYILQQVWAQATGHSTTPLRQRGIGRAHPIIQEIVRRHDGALQYRDSLYELGRIIELKKDSASGNTRKWKSLLRKYKMKRMATDWYERHYDHDSHLEIDKNAFSLDFQFP